MNRRKRLFAFMLILTVTLFGVFAGADWENVLLCQPTNVINNQSVMVELSQAKSIDHASAFGSISYSEPYKSSYKDQGDIVLFTLIDTLDSDDYGTANKTFLIKSDDVTGFYFVKDGNETNKVEYEIDVCLLEFEKPRYGTSYSKTSVSGKMTINTEKTVGESKKTKYYKSGTDEYSITIPTTSYTSLWGLGISGDYPKYIRYYYVCIKILGGQDLEEGSYTTSFHVSSTGLVDSEKYTIKGYVGEKPLADSTDFSFFIDPSTDSYFTDLVVAKNTNSPTKDIAKLQFYYTRRKTYNNTTPNANNLKKKFTIYIAPTNDNSVDTKYVFKKTGTENQADSFANRIYFEIDTTNTTGLTKYGNRNNVYYFYPDYTNQVISSSGNNKTYQEFWKLEDKHIFIKVSNESKEDMEAGDLHSVGTYTSTIYFIIVPDDSV